MNSLPDRLRLRILDVLALIGDESVQRKYQASVPHVNVPAELFNQWEESFCPADEQFRSAFDDVELEALRRFDALVQGVAQNTPRLLPPLDEFVATDPWLLLSTAAQATLQAMRRPA
jgi:hypothetical protein